MVVLCARRCNEQHRVPTPPEKGSANEKFSDWSNGKVVLIVLVLPVLLTLGFLIVGGAHMLAELALHFVAHMVVDLVRRAESMAMHTRKS
jgi:hypothetical protein